MIIQAAKAGPLTAIAGASGATIAGTGERPALLPEPGQAGLDGTQDAMGMMYQLVSEQGQASLSLGQASVTAQSQSQTAALDRERAALQKEEADEASMSGGGLFGDIEHLFSDLGKDLAAGRLDKMAADTVDDTVADSHVWTDLETLAPKVAEYVGIATAVVGAAAMTAATGGAAGIAIVGVAVAISASGMLVAKTGCLGKYSDIIGAGAEVLGAVVSCGASSQLAAGGVLEAATAAGSVVSGGASVVAGAAAIVTGNEQADVVDDTADVQQAMQSIDRSTRIVNELVAGLQDTQTSNKDALKVLAGAAQTYNQTLTLASAGKA
jgi:hypothetical protein